MASTVTNYYALLVGIDMYLNDGSRKNATGDPLYLKNLQGCVNDVRAMREFLRGEFQVNEPHVLTSSVPTDAHSKEPAEPPELWPTFENIKDAFDTITEKAIAGDFFFFHFSGHGAQLQPTERSPKERSVDSSLITMDYCNSNAAIRGWQLNEWLKRLNEKDVCIVVILDSCYSGGGWRTGANIRTPQGWTDVPNNTIDEATITETSSKTGSRDSELESSWGINPKGFTLMAACTSDQQAEERQYGDEHRGAFTYSLLASLQQQLPHSKKISYRNLRDQVQGMLHIQTPRVYGRDRLLFFGNTEPFSSTPIIAQIHADAIFVPMGKFHGVHERSEFMNYPSLDLTFMVNKVDDFQCSARILSPHSEIPNQNSCEVVPSRWSLGSESLRVLVDRDLGNEFRRTLHTAVEQRIVGDIQILDTNDFDDHNAVKLTLKKRDDSSIDIYGPSYLIGYEGPVRGGNIIGEDNHELSINSAIVIRHLTRFSQILALKRLSSKRSPPFELSLVRQDVSLTSKHRLSMRFTLRNNGECQLYFIVLCLGPGFNVKQLYPPQDSPVSLHKERPISFAFRISVPEELRCYSEQRDIIRTIVTKGKPLSWRCLELPHIWNAGRLEQNLQRTSFDRDAIVSTGFCVWVHDEYV